MKMKLAFIAANFIKFNVNMEKCAWFMPKVMKIKTFYLQDSD